MLVTASSWGNEVGTARDHRERFNVIPNALAYHTYLTTASVVEEDRPALMKALAFMMATSSRQPIVEHCQPEQITDTLYHLNLRNIKWDPWDWIAVLKHYPYYHGDSYPLVVRADWLLLQLADSDESNAHYRLLYGSRTAPKTIKQFRAFWDVGDKVEHRYGLVEGRSGVAVQSFRWLENRPAARGYYWETRDSLDIIPGKDPLEALDGKFGFDGQEVIAGVPKVSLTTGTRGVLQVYFLADGKGNRVEQAPTDLVEDHSRFRNLAAIRTSGSCIGCHITGILLPTTNEARDLIKLGVDIYAKDKKTQEQIELFHLGDTKDEIEYQQKQYAKGVMAVNGLTPEANAKGFKQAVEAYDKPLSLESAGRELYTTGAELRLALANYNNIGKSLPARLAALAHGKPIPRKTFEQHYHLLTLAVEAWGQK